MTHADTPKEREIVTSTDGYALQLATPLGPLTLVSRDGQSLDRIDFPRETNLALIRGFTVAAPLTAKSGSELPRQDERAPVLLQAAQQLLEYFAGQRRVFSLSLNVVGTSFQRRVWEELSSIPYGETRTYGQVAACLGQPGASRAVGQANHDNPIPIIVPCHRVIGANGKLTGFAPGLSFKRYLLDLERWYSGLGAGNMLKNASTRDGLADNQGG